MSKSETCYFANASCIGKAWKCKTCGENFCQSHWHRTSKGTNVECVACERTRLDEEANAKEAADRKAWEQADDARRDNSARLAGEQANAVSYAIIQAEAVDSSCHSSADSFSSPSTDSGSCSSSDSGSSAGD